MNKLENPDAIRRVVERLPYGIRRKWREIDIIQRENREATVENLAKFVREKSQSCHASSLRNH